MKKSISLALAAVMLAACQVEEAPQPGLDPAVPEGYKVLTIEASREAASKTSYAGDVSFSWSVGDRISVLCNDGADNFLQTFEATKAAATSPFTAIVPGNVNLGPKDASSHRLALFPASDSHVYENDWTLSFHIPQERDYRAAKGGHVSADLPMFAWGNEQDVYRFSHLTGAVKFRFTGISCPSVKMSFTVGGVKLNGVYKLYYDGGINVSDASNVKWNAADAGSAAEKTVTYYGDVVNGGVSFYLPYAAGGIWGNSTLTLSDASTNEVLFSSDKVGTINVTRNKVTVLPLVDVSAGGEEILFESAYGIDWSGITETESTDASTPVIRSMRATADMDYLYLLLKLDASKMEPDHTFAHRFNLYAGDWSTGLGAQSWAVYKGDAAYYNWQSDYSDYHTDTSGGNTWFYEIRLSRTHSTTVSALGAPGTVKIGVKLDNRVCDTVNGAEVYGYANGGSSTTTIGKIPSSSSLYSVTLPGGGSSQDGPVNIKRTFTESDAEYANPERGLYKMVEYKYHKRKDKTEEPTSDYTSATSSVKDSYYQCYESSSNTNTLVMTLFYLFDYVNADHIDANGKKYVRDVLTNIRSQGKKAIVRFAYNCLHPSSHDQEPTLEQILNHLEDLTPIFTDFEDVIYVVQAGFIGTYGEWYYTTHFGPSSGGVEFSVNKNTYKVTGYENRAAVITGLLNAFPESRQIGLRTPEYKACYLNPSNISAYENLSGFGTDAVHRLAFHNDAFLYGGEDMGTFHYDWTRTMWAQQGAYLINGGEAPYSSKSVSQMEGYTYSNVMAAIYKYHYSYLHHDTAYHSGSDSGSSLMKHWHQQDWMKDIVKWLGYRLYLTNATITGNGLTSGTTLDFSLTLQNSGAAPVVNERPMELVLIHSGKATVLSDDIGDVRLVPCGTVSGTTVKPGSKTYSFSVTLPQDVVTGDKLAIWLPDQDPNQQGLQNRAAYSIRLANNETSWTSGGYNVFYTF